MKALPLFLCSLYCIFKISCTEDQMKMESVFKTPSEKDSLSDYLPSIINDTTEKRDFFKNYTQRWVSSSLYSFKEPILQHENYEGTIYRLLWLRSFNKPICFTWIEIDNNFYLKAQVLDRYPEFNDQCTTVGTNSSGVEIYDTLKADRLALIEFKKVKVLRSKQWGKLDNIMSDMNFWNAAIEETVAPSTDGSSWYLEGRRRGEYKLIIRHDENLEQLKKLATYLLSISDLNIPEDEIY